MATLLVSTLAQPQPQPQPHHPSPLTPSQLSSAAVPPQMPQMPQMLHFGGGDGGIAEGPYGTRNVHTVRK